MPENQKIQLKVQEKTDVATTSLTLISAFCVGVLLGLAVLSVSFNYLSGGFREGVFRIATTIRDPNCGCLGLNYYDCEILGGPTLDCDWNYSKGSEGLCEPDEKFCCRENFLKPCGYPYEPNIVGPGQCCDPKAEKCKLFSDIAGTSKTPICVARNADGKCYDIDGCLMEYNFRKYPDDNCCVRGKICRIIGIGEGAYGICLYSSYFLNNN